MQSTFVKLDEIKLMGITTRTNNQHLFETDPSTNKIALTVQKYFHNQLFEKIPNRQYPGKTFCVYTNYESDFSGDYTYFIGEQVIDFEQSQGDFETLLIPTQRYVKFTNAPGKMPDVCIEMWQSIWMMKPTDLGGKRGYIADFELYDERSLDHQNAVLDIYVGLAPE